MADMTASARPSEITIQAVVIRCDCGEPASHPDAPCPAGRPVDLGRIAYWHRNPIRRLVYWLARRAPRHRPTQE
jgi:hypothetical protein